jgi:hypothetical protein
MYLCERPECGELGLRGLQFRQEFRRRRAITLDLHTKLEGRDPTTPRGECRALARNAERRASSGDT